MKQWCCILWLRPVIVIRKGKALIMPFQTMFILRGFRKSGASESCNTLFLFIFFKRIEHSSFRLREVAKYYYIGIFEAILQLFPLWVEHLNLFNYSNFTLAKKKLNDTKQNFLSFLHMKLNVYFKHCWKREIIKTSTGDKKWQGSL